MDKLQLYIVSGYTFSLTISESEPIWQNMHSSFDAFIENNSNQLLFRFTTKEDITDIAVTPIYIDNNCKLQVSKLNASRTDNGYLYEIFAAFINNLIERLYIDNKFSAAEMNLKD